jgi:hypothetical protein
MDTIKKTVLTVYRLSTLLVVGFITWKVVRCWRAGTAEKAGRTLDSSIGAAGATLEKNAIALDALSGKGTGENLGKEVDEVLTDTKKSLENATDLVKSALKK